MAKKSGPAARIRELEKELRKHQHLYYVKNQPVISDREFDRLFTELQKLEEEHPELASDDSPTKVVGSDLDNTFSKVEHTIPVLSLANTYSTEEALEWAEKATGGKKTMKIIVQWKVDGASLVVYYEKGRLARAVTRGTGSVGDDITSNARTIRNIPQVLSKPLDLAVRGEVYMTFSDFEKFNEREGSIYANPRNTASGSLKHKQSKEVAGRPLRLVAFEGHFEKSPPPTDAKAMKQLDDLGFPLLEDQIIVPLSKLEATIAKFEKVKDKMPMPVDGLVLKLDDHKERNKLGFTAHSPRWAVALKFEPELGETVVEEIEVFTGRTGRVTPRARLQPVQLAGTTVTYATLHNPDFIKSLGVRVGSRVKVSKRGEIIPAVEEVVDPGPGKPYRFPTKCPVCSTKLVQEEGAVDRVCPNPRCDEKLINGLIFFCQRKQMDIVGMGEKIVRTLYEKKFIADIPDIYGLEKHREELEGMEGFGKKSVQVLLGGIEKSKTRAFRFVLPALGLRELGHSVTDLLIKHDYDDIDKITALASGADAEERLNEIDGIGPRTTEFIVGHFKDKNVKKLIKDLRGAGLQFAAKKVKADPDMPQNMTDQTWVVTGSFENFKPRELAADEIRKRGGKISAGVSSKTTHLLAGKSGQQTQEGRGTGHDHRFRDRLSETAQEEKVNARPGSDSNFSGAAPPHGGSRPAHRRGDFHELFPIAPGQEKARRPKRRTGPAGLGSERTRPGKLERPVGVLLVGSP